MVNETISYILFLMWISLSFVIGGYIGWKWAEFTCPYRAKNVKYESGTYDN